MITKYTRFTSPCIPVFSHLYECNSLKTLIKTGGILSSSHAGSCCQEGACSACPAGRAARGKPHRRRSDAVTRSTADTLPIQACTAHDICRQLRIAQQAAPQADKIRHSCTHSEMGHSRQPFLQVAVSRAHDHHVGKVFFNLSCGPDMLCNLVKRIHGVKSQNCCKKDDMIMQLFAACPLIDPVEVIPVQL
jgi:tRNA-dihydrouridine synthase